MTSLSDNSPREGEISVVECFCDHCNSRLDRLKKIWIWNEHFGCSRDHVQRAQAKANSGEQPTPAQKRMEKAVKSFEKVEHLFEEENDRDLL